MRRDWRAYIAAALVLAVYGAVLAVMPPGAFWSPDEGAKFLQLRSIHWDGGPHYAIPYAGATIDPVFDFYPTRCRHEDLYPVRLPDGGVKFHWPIWFSLLTRPLADAFGNTGLYVTPLISGWLIAVLSGGLVAAYDARLAPLAILSVGLATPVAFFSLTHWEHTLASLLALTALALLMQDSPARRPAVRRLALPLLLAAVALRLDVAPLALAVGAGWTIARRRCAAGDGGVPSRRPGRAQLALAVVVAAGVAIAAAATLPARHLWLLRTLPQYLLGDLRKLPRLPQILTDVFIDAPGNQAPDLEPLMRAVGLVAFGAAAAAPFVGNRRVGAALGLAALFTALQFSVYLGLLPEPYISLHGFFPAAPIAVVAAYTMREAWQARRFDRLLLTTTAWLYVPIAFGVIFTFAVEPDGRYRTGLEWGNRYLFTLYPLGTVLGIAALVAYRPTLPGSFARHAFAALVAALLLCGLQFEVRGLSMLLDSRRLIASWDGALRGAAPVVTDIWWLPAATAPLFTEQPMSCVRNPGDLAGWFPGALAQGVGSFTFASFHDVEASRFVAPGVEVVRGEDRTVGGLHVTRFRLVPRPPADDRAAGGGDG